MRMGRPIPELVVAPQERSALQNWARRPKSAQALALRAKIILGVCRRQVEHRSGQPVSDHQANGRKMAGALCRTASGRVAG
jgi:hypothetical protein